MLRLAAARAACQPPRAVQGPPLVNALRKPGLACQHQPSEKRGGGGGVEAAVTPQDCAPHIRCGVGVTLLPATPTESKRGGEHNSC